jgi:hypothetical protein
MAIRRNIVHQSIFVWWSHRQGPKVLPPISPFETDPPLGTIDLYDNVSTTAASGIQGTGGIPGNVCENKGSIKYFSIKVADFA